MLMKLKNMMAIEYDGINDGDNIGVDDDLERCEDTRINKDDDNDKDNKRMGVQRC